MNIINHVRGAVKLADDNGEGVWRTINGRATFIPEGQDVKDVMKSTFGKGEAEKQDNVLKMVIGSKSTTIIKNPSDAEIDYLNDKFKEKYGNPRGEVKIRQTIDKDGNTYAWMAGDAVHSDVEGFLKDKFGGEYSQNNEPKGR